MSVADTTNDDSILVLFKYITCRNTRQVAFQTSIHCQNKEILKYDQAEDLEDASLKAAELLQKWF